MQVIEGIDATVVKAKEFFEQGDLRFAAELASHAVFAAPEDAAARELLADVFERLGTARSARRGATATSPVRPSCGRTGSSTRSWIRRGCPGAHRDAALDSIAIRIDGPKAWSEHLTLNWHIADIGEHYRMELNNGARILYPTSDNVVADLELSLTRLQLSALVFAGRTDGVDMSGDGDALGKLVGLIDSTDPDFAIVTP